MASGDMGYVDENGRLFIVGRDDEMIVSGGENVYPIEVEKTLASHDDVAEAAVIGVDDEQYGQRLAAFVVLNEGAGATPDTLKQHVRDNLANYKVPRADHGARRTAPQHHGQDRPHGTQRNGRAMGKRRPLLRASVELANAANAVRPLGREGYPTIPVFFARLADHRDVAAVPGRVGARTRCGGGCGVTSQPVAGESSLLVTAITWGLL